MTNLPSETEGLDLLELAFSQIVDLLELRLSKKRSNKSTFSHSTWIKQEGLDFSFGEVRLCHATTSSKGIVVVIALNWKVPSNKSRPSVSEGRFV